VLTGIPFGHQSPLLAYLHGDTKQLPLFGLQPIKKAAPFGAAPSIESYFIF
jgi:hypothetical protein